MVDVVTYSGDINRRGYEKLCDVLGNKKSKDVLLVLATYGGDPHAGFRIARALHHEYGEFSALVPRFCKSAGTLILVGASNLYLDDMSELGPLDVQVKKGDELTGRSSGLDIFQAITYLQNQNLSAFRQYLWSLTQEHGLSTKVASDIATQLTLGLFEPIAAQIDPIKLAEMQRATEIAHAYGNLLNERSMNLREHGMARLVSGYPSHGFVIDRKEAKSIFIRIEKPEGILAQLSKSLFTTMAPTVSEQDPVVNILHYGTDQGQDHEPVDENAAGSLPEHAGGQPEEHGELPDA